MASCWKDERTRRSEHGLLRPAGVQQKSEDLMKKGDHLATRNPSYLNRLSAYREGHPKDKSPGAKSPSLWTLAPCGLRSQHQPRRSVQSKKQTPGFDRRHLFHRVTVICTYELLP